MHDPADILRRLAMHDDAFIELVLARGFQGSSSSGLDARTQALVRVGALVSANADASAYQGAVESALGAGARPGELVGVLVALLPSIGAERVVGATPKLALALGYDVDEALEQREALSSLEAGNAWRKA